jgi:dihydropteroate synthase
MTISQTRPSGLIAPRWQLRTRTLEFTSLPRLMGIVNVTPDSFSDGGDFADPGLAIEHGLKLVAEGADLLDIGGESTRPYSIQVDAAEELQRVLPVIRGLVRQASVPLSIDTSKSHVAQAALDEGVEIVNDVTGLSGDATMLDVCHEARCGVCAMHMQGSPQTMQDNPTYDNVVAEIADYLAARKLTLLAAGIELERICLDPGIGFGKTHEHNLTLLANCGQFHSLGTPLLVGHSRKGFIGKVLGDKQAPRGYGTIGVSLALARQGVQVLRLHEIRPTAEALKLFAAAGGLGS